ncbi:MAG: hypothetical protein ACM3NW_09065, partial [Syntrophomonadaceae bacterium]
MSDPRSREREEFRARTRKGRRVPVARAVPADVLTPVMLFRRLRASGEETFLLESVEGGETLARYTFLGAGPVARWVLRDGVATVEGEGGAARAAGLPIASLERFARGGELVPDPGLPQLSSGAVGFLAYDAVRLFEEIPDRHAPEGAVPDGLFLLFDSVIAFDHPRQTVLFLTTLDLGDGGDASAEADRAIARLDRLEALAFAPDPPAKGRPAPAARPSTAFAPAAPRERFLEAVDVVKEAIASGEVYQCVLSQRWTARLALDPFDVY